MSKFYVYSKIGCGYCVKLISFMESKGIEYEKFTVGQDLTSEQFVNKFGRSSSFPQVLHNTKHIGGMRDTVRYLLNNNIV